MPPLGILAASPRSRLRRSTACLPKKTPKGKGEAAAATHKSTRKASDRSPPFSTAATRRGARGMPQTESAEHEAADETAANEVAGVRARAQ